MKLKILIIVFKEIFKNQTFNVQSIIYSNKVKEMNYKIK